MKKDIKGLENFKKFVRRIKVDCQENFNERNEQVNNLLVKIFNRILKYEALSVRKISNNKLTLSEVHTLEAIGINKIKTMTTVAKQLTITVSTLTTCINRLVARGYVERLKVEDDRRIVCIKLTEEGAFMVKAHKVFHTQFVSDSLKGLSSLQVEILVLTLENILSSVSNEKFLEKII